MHALAGLVGTMDRGGRIDLAGRGGVMYVPARMVGMGRGNGMDLAG